MLRVILLIEPNSQGKKRCPTTAVRYLSSLSHVFTVAIKEWGWLSENPVRKISKPKVANGRVRFLSDDERIRLLEACKQSRCSILYLVVILALSTGMRCGEIMNLTRGDIDIENGVITLKDTKNGARQLRAIEALVENDVLVQDLGSIIGALNPRQTIMELRRQGFYGIIKTRRFREKDRDKKTCWPGEYYISKVYKPAVEEVLKKCATSVSEISEAAKNDIHSHLNVEEVKKCKN